MSLFCCPICKESLHINSSGYHCANGHCFDRAAAGYTHLLPANRKHSKQPGDDQAMVAARSAFLEKGYYATLRETLCNRICGDLADISAPAILDSGCGEGYYTAGIYQTLVQLGRQVQLAGIDISKFAVRRAAKRVPEGEFAVASVYHLPIKENCIHALTNIFSPLCVEEFRRVLQPGGYFYYVVPSAQHLWEMKEVLYDSPYPNPVRTEQYEGFQWMTAIPVREQISLTSPEDIMALFGMTPYAWKTPKAGIQRLSERGSLTTQIGFDIHVYLRH